MPAELMEKILLNLPVKSVIRFSTASKLWNSIISEPKFAQSYRGREMIVLKSIRRKRTLGCPLSSMSSDNPIDGATPLDSPRGSLLASCGYLWLWYLKKSLLLYNPTIQTYRKLPNPVSGLNPHSAYGLGYDSVCDDYKILKIQKSVYDDEDVKIEMYSLRSDCWRKVESQPPHLISKLLSECVFANGAIHWLITRTLWNENGVKLIAKKINILSFDLSEEKFGLMELPEQQNQLLYELGMIVFGGKLLVYGNDDYSNFSVWVMEDYESKLWTKEMEFGFGYLPETCWFELRPFYFYDDVGNLVRAVISLNDREKMFIYKEEEDDFYDDDGNLIRQVISLNDREEMFIYKEEEEDEGSSSSTSTLVEKNFGSNRFDLIGSLTYVESIVDPLTWNRSSGKANADEYVVSCWCFAPRLRAAASMREMRRRWRRNWGLGGGM